MTAAPSGGRTRGHRVAPAAAILLFVSACVVPGPTPATHVAVGSKTFTESVILGELVTRLAVAGGAEAVHRRQLGGTRILWEGLLSGEIDVYPEYTGTIAEEILAGTDVAGEQEMRAELRRRGVELSRPLGFNNTYVIGMLEEVADQLGVRTISDLRDHPQLRLGFSNEFMDRGDGWPSLRSAYGLPQTEVNGLDHDLAYRALAARSIDAIDLYSTDAEIEFYGIRPLVDDLGHFPEYQAVLLYRAGLAERAPEAVRRMLRLEGAIDAPRMIAMNARVKIGRESEGRVAAEFLDGELGVASIATGDSALARFGRNLRGHLELVAISLLASIVVAVPLGVVAARLPRAGQLILGAVGIVQTIPSLALFVFMIPLLGIGAAPAIAALFLYSLLPIVRNTHAGLVSIPSPYIESATALGLEPATRLRLVELPMASLSILAGIKTSSVINVGTATLAALIGAPGFGQPILTGIRLADTGLIMQGAVPAALLALVAQGLFEIVERLLVPRGLRLESGA
ncbi:MAG: glycine betaine ABC transporter substrate-binding protein [Acidobacteriota bacterium]|jgi:osmoprotectant transport system permease protein